MPDITYEQLHALEEAINNMAITTSNIISIIHSREEDTPKCGPQTMEHQSEPADQLQAAPAPRFRSSSNVEVVETSPGEWSVIAVKRMTVAIAGSRNDALHIANTFDL